MSGGHNRKFVADPAGYAGDKVILLPLHDKKGFWSAVQKGPFDLSEVSDSGFDGTVLALTHMTRRGKNTSIVTKPIDGVWVPYRPNDVYEVPVTAKGSSFFVFTSRLGGCALGIKDLNQADTTFTHDARNATQQATRLAKSAVTLKTAEYDPGNDGVNITAFFWWNGTKWQLGQSATYDAQLGNGQKLVHGDDEYPYKNGLGPKY